MLKTFLRVGVLLDTASCGRHLVRLHPEPVRRYHSDNGSKAKSWSDRVWESLRKKRSTEETSGPSKRTGSSDLVPSDPYSRHKEVLVVPLGRKPLFPSTMVPLQVTDKKLLDELVELQNQGNGDVYVGAFLQKDTPEGAGAAKPGERLKASSLHPIGTFAHVHTIHYGSGAQNGTAMVLLVGHRRLKLEKTVAANPLRVRVKHLVNKPFNARDDVLVASTMEVVSTLKDLLTLHPLYNEHLKVFANAGGDLNTPGKIADMAASITSADQTALQGILEELDVVQRMQKTLLLLKKEVELCKLQLDIGKQVEQKISNDQRRYFLTEQLKSIKRELGMEKDDKSAAVTKYEEFLAKTGNDMSKEARKVMEEEIAKLSTLESSSAEFNVTRNYLDWIVNLPWGLKTTESYNLAFAKEVLEQDHYGLQDVKDRVLEFIAVSRMQSKATGKILCLAGPPGVGKTSVGKSIARALNRKYYRFSVGGLSDIAEIKGHRRTYVGAMPGKMIQCLKSTKRNNPLVLIDEIDKLGKGWQGDPAGALLEMLDPEQNKGFVDHFLDIPVDLSSVLFMCTANQLDTIPRPLLDRMEIIEVSGYIANEKYHIARNHLEPQTRKESGIPEGTSSITEEALRTLITEHCREPGVRALRRKLEQIYRKVAVKMVQKVEEYESAVTNTEEPNSPRISEEGPGEGSKEVDGSEITAIRELGKELSGAINVERFVKEMVVNPRDELLEGGNDEDDEADTDDNNGPDEEDDHDDDRSVSDDGVDEEENRLETSDNDDAATLESGSESNKASAISDEECDSIAALTKRLQAVEEGDQLSRLSFRMLEKKVQTLKNRLRDKALRGIDPIVVDQAGLADYIGQPPFSSDKIYNSTPAGVTMGLSTSQMGGGTLYIEAAAVEKGKGKGSLQATGQLGQVMQESSKIAHTFVRSFALGAGPAASQKLEKFYSETAIHLHVPEGAVSKEGPSAGCAMVTSLLSLGLDKPVRPNLAMTGEVTLTGRVLPVGGIKEKLLAARRSGVTNIIFPQANKQDFDELTDDVKEGITPHFAESYSQVYDIALQYDQQEASESKKGSEAAVWA